ncbi:hypothetical protein FO519_003853 [Halicephalobus sp. NKZ332]|nr:hypothetical protein FO519_003853 [Halicephalobus sp. NKZ332]
MWRFLLVCTTFSQLCGTNAKFSNSTEKLQIGSMEFGSFVTVKPALEDQTYCGKPHPAYCTTSISLDSQNRTVARASRLSPAIFQCPLLKSTKFSKGLISWFRFDSSEPIGYYNFGSKKAFTTNSFNGMFRIFNDSGLLVSETSRMVVDRYICLYSSTLEELRKINNTADLTSVGPENIVLLRLDYAKWYSPVIFESVFYGSVIASILLCGSAFVLNIIWIIIQKIGLTIIRRREKRKGAQSFLQAMEAYRQTQIRSLQDAYHRKMRIVSDHYHRQVEQIRDAYMNQMTRIKDYGQTQYDSYVATHVDTVRESYNAQLTRLREFGSKRADQLFEGYERQLNRLRAFTLAQRMRLMRQYHLQQRDVNELLEKFPDHDVAEAVNREDLLRLANTDLPFPETRARLQRSLSCVSLPEFMLVDDEEKEVLQRVSAPRPTTAQSDVLSHPAFPRLRNNLRPASECEFIPNSPVKSNVPKTPEKVTLPREGPGSENQPLLDTECVVVDESLAVQYPMTTSVNSEDPPLTEP